MLNKVISPCKEMCYEAYYACSPRTYPPDCDYLPSVGGNISCMHDPVFCMAPPIVKHSTMKINNTELGYFLNDTVEYFCDEGYEMVGNKSISCTYSGRWSTPPRCLLKPGNQIYTEPSPGCSASTDKYTVSSGIIICSKIQNEIGKKTKI